MNKDRDGDTTIKEGYEKKEGVNSKPTRQKPPNPPPAQKGKPMIKTKVFYLEEFDGNVGKLFKAVKKFQCEHNVIQIFANDLFDDAKQLVEVLYCPTISSVSFSFMVAD